MPPRLTAPGKKLSDVKKRIRYAEAWKSFAKDLSLNHDREFPALTEPPQGASEWHTLLTPDIVLRPFNNSSATIPTRLCTHSRISARNGDRSSIAADWTDRRAY